MGDAAFRCGFRVDRVVVLEILPSVEFQKQIDENQKLSASLSSELYHKEKRRELEAVEDEDRRNAVETDEELRKKKIRADARLEEETQRLEETALENRWALRLKEHQVERTIQKEKDSLLLEFLGTLKEEMDVDVTEFLCSAG